MNISDAYICDHSSIFSIKDANLRCEFVSKYCNGEHFNFYKIPFCLLPQFPVTSFITIFLLVILHFFFLSTTGTKEVSNPLTKLVTHLKLHQNIAGITFLAIGNGAPDVISSIVASSDTSGLDLTIGALIGAGCFTTCVVLSTVIFIGKDVPINKNMFNRDLSLYLISLGWIGFVFYKGKIELYDPLFYLLLYSANVFIAVWQIRQEKKHNIEVEELDYEKSEYSVTHSENIVRIVDNDYFYNKEKNTVDQGPKNVGNTSNGYFYYVSYYIYKNHLNEEETLFFKMTSFSKCIYLFIELPMDLLKAITIPECREEYWNKTLFVISPVTSFIFILIANKKLDILYNFTSLMISLSILTLLVLFLHFTTYRSKQPSCTVFLCLYSFSMSIVWIWFASANLVDLLKMIGVILNISESFVGMTFLAFGNSIADLALNSKLAKNGFGEMAVTGSIAGPMFNLLIGFGLGLTRMIITNGEHIHYTASKLCEVSLGILILNLVRLLIEAKMSNYSLKRLVAYLGYLTYIIFGIVIFYMTFT